MLEEINQVIKGECRIFLDMSDDLHRHPEPAYQEYYASARLCDWLEEHGFSVERGIGGIPTAFRAVRQQGEGGVSIGLLAEYDANPNGHSCGHHLQGPVILNAVSALMQCVIGPSFRLVVYGTPAEEVLTGKCRMLEEGCFQDIDVALQVHAFDTTGPHSGLAGCDLHAVFETDVSVGGLSVLQPANASDAFALAVEGMSFLRKRMPFGARIFQSIGEPDAGGDEERGANCEAVFSFRCLDYRQVDAVEDSMRAVLRGAAMAVGAAVSIDKTLEARDVVHVPELTGLWVQKARELESPRIVEAAPSTSSTTDFGAVTHRVPGSIIWFAAAPEGTALHSDRFETLGCSDEAHDGMVTAAQILAQTCYDLITVPGLMQKIRASHCRIMGERMMAL